MPKWAWLLAIIACNLPIGARGRYYEQLKFEEITQVMSEDDPTGANHHIRVVISPHTPLVSIVEWKLSLLKEDREPLTYSIEGDGNDPTMQTEFTFQGNLLESDYIALYAKDHSRVIAHATMIVQIRDDLQSYAAWVGDHSSASSASLRVVPGQLVGDVQVNDILCDPDQSPCYYIEPNPKPIGLERCYNPIPDLKQCDDRITEFKVISLCNNKVLEIEITSDGTEPLLEVVAYDPQNPSNIFSEYPYKCTFPDGLGWHEGDRVQCQQDLNLPDGQGAINVLVVRLDENGRVYESSLQTYRDPTYYHQFHFQEIRQVMNEDDPTGENHNIKLVISSHDPLENIVEWKLSLLEEDREPITYTTSGDGSNPSLQTEFIFQGNLLDSDSIALYAKNSTKAVAHTITAVELKGDLHSYANWVGSYKTGQSASLRVSPGQLIKEVQVNDFTCDLDQSPCYYLEPDKKPAEIERCYSLTEGLMQCDDRIMGFKEPSSLPDVSLTNDNVLEIEVTLTGEEPVLEVIAYDPEDASNIFTEFPYACVFPAMEQWNEGEKAKCQQEINLPEGQTVVNVLIVKLDADGSVSESCLQVYGDTKPDDLFSFLEIRQVNDEEDPTGEGQFLKVVISEHEPLDNIIQWKLTLLEEDREPITYATDGDGSDPSLQTEFLFEGSLLKSDAITLYAKNQEKAVAHITMEVDIVDDLQSDVDWVGDYQTGQASLRVVPGQLIGEVQVNDISCDPEQSPCYYIEPDPKPTFVERCYNPTPDFKQCDDRITPFKESNSLPAISLLDRESLEIMVAFTGVKPVMEVIAYDPQDTSNIFSDFPYKCTFPIGLQWEEDEQIRCQQSINLPEGQTNMMVLIVQLDEDGHVSESSLQLYGEKRSSELFSFKEIRQVTTEDDPAGEHQHIRVVISSHDPLDNIVEWKLTLRERDREPITYATDADGSNPSLQTKFVFQGELLESDAVTLYAKNATKAVAHTTMTVDIKDDLNSGVDWVGTIGPGQDASLRVTSGELIGEIEVNDLTCSPDQSPCYFMEIEEDPTISERCFNPTPELIQCDDRINPFKEFSSSPVISLHGSNILEVEVPFTNENPILEVIAYDPLDGTNFYSEFPYKCSFPHELWWVEGESIKCRQFIFLPEGQSIMNVLIVELDADGHIVASSLQKYGETDVPEPEEEEEEEKGEVEETEEVEETKEEKEEEQEEVVAEVKITDLTIEEIRQVTNEDDLDGDYIKVVISPHDLLDNVAEWTLSLLNEGRDPITYTIDGQGGDPSQTEFLFEGTLTDSDSVNLSAMNDAGAVAEAILAAEIQGDINAAADWVGDYRTGQSSVRVSPGQLVEEVQVNDISCDSDHSPCYYIEPDPKPDAIKRCYNPTPEVLQCDDRIHKFKASSNLPGVSLFDDQHLEVEVIFSGEKPIYEVVTYDPLDNGNIFSEFPFRCTFPVGVWWDIGQRIKCRHHIHLPQDQTSMMVLVVKLDENDDVAESSIQAYEAKRHSDQLVLQEIRQVLSEDDPTGRDHNIKVVIAPHDPLHNIVEWKLALVENHRVPVTYSTDGDGSNPSLQTEIVFHGNLISCSTITLYARNGTSTIAHVTMNAAITDDLDSPADWVSNKREDQDASLRVTAGHLVEEVQVNGILCDPDHSPCYYIEPEPEPTIVERCYSPSSTLKQCDDRIAAFQETSHLPFISLINNKSLEIEVFVDGDAPVLEVVAYDTKDHSKVYSPFPYKCPFPVGEEPDGDTVKCQQDIEIPEVLEDMNIMVVKLDGNGHVLESSIQFYGENFPPSRTNIKSIIFGSIIAVLVGIAFILLMVVACIRDKDRVAKKLAKRNRSTVYEPTTTSIPDEEVSNHLSQDKDL